MQIQVSKDYFHVYQALCSETRIEIIEILSNNQSNISDLARQLNISPAIVTRHVQKLEEAGIVKSIRTPGKSGLQKIVQLAIDHIDIQFPKKIFKEYLLHLTDLKIGHYTDFQAKPTCGIATEKEVIGKPDDPKYFMDSKRVDTQLLWLSEGFVEYKIPNLLSPNQIPEMVEISLELASEFPLSNNVWPSDITFYMNNVKLGTYTVPGNFSDVRGRYTPSWWNDKFSQYGLLKTIRINKIDTGIDGEPLSSVTIDDLQLEQSPILTLKIAAEQDSKKVGGLTLFGEHFGNHRQNIRVGIYYLEKEI
ncbi:ArsR/SmtB family transcription factor [Bacillus sp. B1-b2]|uniref:ArsR/SmtB family transcription factor n=1 Tax=Bacillus sp. B1-b2 TaxID=2653201 RepID=UPI0012628295|nr:ArsR family transcriptional regulator [Bacillus sp. B1-b2]KAB7669223.1 ArsR family transcriptional regulator [Bacillus sp. B1-b2]